ncbi:hypothetical protein M0811_07677 [Anaeramoeba ignava]|uniref:Uncharacterized protein n=1 Tax=Anaeramoeba ignava TaxID=1746090 RepID=A0A9Q0LLF5_ANAIG|nr:hypothetical protein M0811_07677 [Anaeramoeba ignava]
MQKRFERKLKCVKRIKKSLEDVEKFGRIEKWKMLIRKPKKLEETKKKGIEEDGDYLEGKRSSEGCEIELLITFWNEKRVGLISTTAAEKQKTNNVSFSFAIKSSQIKDSSSILWNIFEGDGFAESGFYSRRNFPNSKTNYQNLQKEESKFLLGSMK